ncbi:acyl-CoA dehydrogenase [Nocardioides pacificus]
MSSRTDSLRRRSSGIASTPEQVAVQDAVRAFARSAQVIEAARDESAEAWRKIWPGLAELGMFAVTVPEEHGGAEADLVDLAVMVEQAGVEGVPGPVVPTAAAAHLLGRVTLPDGAAAEARDAVLAGDLTVAITRPGLAPLAGDDGRLTGDLGAVAGATADAALLVPAQVDGRRTWCLVLPGAGVSVTPLDGLDVATPLATVTLDGAPALSLGGPANGLAEHEVEDTHLLVAAALAAGIAGRTLEVAASYAALREQFGRPIGSFQAIKHLCAEMLCRAEQARVAAWDASVAEPAERSLAVAVAGAIALDAAVDNAKDCIQVLGGIGYTWEHDAHLFLRRALVLRQTLGGSAHWRARVAQLVRAGERRHLGVELGEVESRREEVRRAVALLVGMEGRELRAALAESGLYAPHWPAPYGMDAGPALQVLVAQELERAGVSRPDLVIGWWAMPTILAGGTPEQVERFAMPTLRGDVAWCQLFSEPGAGSDLASLSTSATRVDGGWSLSGQKVWTSAAVTADWGICLARTDKDAPKHKGITYFLVDMRTPGLDVRPLREITGEALFNEVFLDDVFVPDDCVVGEVDDGWRLARTTLANERVEMGGSSSMGSGTEELVARAAAHTGELVDDRLGHLVAQTMSTALLGHRALLAQIGGGQPGAESSVQKIVGVRARQDAAELSLELVGDEGLVRGPVSREMLSARAHSIAGGSSQILLSLIGERILGLPR